MIVDCHVNINDPHQFTPPETDYKGTARPGGVDMAADADTIFKAMADVDKAIIFSPRYKDSVGIDGNDEVEPDIPDRRLAEEPGEPVDHGEPT